MASVWLSRLRGKRGFEKLFAIKTIKTELTGDARFQEMFLDEARIASAIQHPNVAQILDLGEQDDILYIVMEWVDGDSLAKIRRLAQNKGTPLPLGLALRVLADACAGLHAAHELCDRQGKRLLVVHRDVSPHNLLVSSAGSAKVIDFGVAKALDRQGGDTRTGIVKGKIRYMAPEQAQGKRVDRRADIWAVGVCLHELATGELPFDGESDVDVLRRLMGDEPPPRAGGAIAQPIEDLLASSLVRDPEARFPTAAAMQRAIQSAIEELGLPSSHEDIASFLRENLPNLETKRRDAVDKALASSQRREAGQVGGHPQAAARAGGHPQAAGPPAPVAEDAALAPTVASSPQPERRVQPETETIAAPSKKSATKAARTGQVGGHPQAPGKARSAKRTRAAKTDTHADESKLTPAPSAIPEEKADRPRRGLWWAAAVPAVAAAAWFVWPGGAKLRAMVAPEPPPEPPPQAAPAIVHSVPPSVAAPTRPASVTATATPASTTASTAASGTAPPPDAGAAAKLGDTPKPPVGKAAGVDAGRRPRKPRAPAPEGSAAPAAPEEESPYD
jgi:serine/threonine protein kinase